jgi:hypothetical protein
MHVRHLGEQNHWAKCTNFDHAVHAPLIFVLPPHLRAQPASFLTITGAPCAMEIMGYHKNMET